MYGCGRVAVTDRHLDDHCGRFSRERSDVMTVEAELAAAFVAGIFVAALFAFLNVWR